MIKHVVITGTSRGIGFELAQLFAASGHEVLALSRRTDSIRALGLKNCHTLSCDITNQDDLNKAESFVADHWPQVDIVINNAGFLINKPFTQLTANDMQRMYAVNTFGPIALIQTLMPMMAKDGHVVSLSSMGGVQGSAKFAGLTGYSSSKGALNVLSEVLAEEYKDQGLKFNVLALGAVQTEMLQEAFPGYQAPHSAREMAQYIMKFALEDGRFFNGKILPVSQSTP
ncbi:MAG: SDR family NAD(P)-dependent oxidoreductase [Flavobacteriaceae bacterium]|nr:SDR family NAD(P)-dependent oxidoreductase [Flavobacteriaceae bacterium]MDG1962518.1 SDR family NAD(P)-dependent oxidoreductase [Flavobacteriaceae bacterium]